jgi:hypothetical protein
MKIYLYIIFVIVLAVSCTTSYEPGEMAPDADPNHLPDLIGTYVINGVDPLGDEYGGHLTVTKGEDPDIFYLQWIVVGGIQEGIGFVKGNQLIVDWQTIKGSESATGQAVFTITEAGQLYGIRTSDHLDGEGQEQAYPNLQ